MYHLVMEISLFHFINFDRKFDLSFNVKNYKFKDHVLIYMVNNKVIYLHYIIINLAKFIFH